MQQKTLDDLLRELLAPASPDDPICEHGTYREAFEQAAAQLTRDLEADPKICLVQEAFRCEARAILVKTIALRYVAAVTGQPFALRGALSPELKEAAANLAAQFDGDAEVLRHPDLLERTFRIADNLGQMVHLARQPTEGQA